MEKHNALLVGKRARVCAVCCRCETARAPLQRVGCAAGPGEEETGEEDDAHKDNNNAGSKKDKREKRRGKGKEEMKKQRKRKSRSKDRCILKEPCPKDVSH